MIRSQSMQLLQTQRDEKARLVTPVFSHPQTRRLFLTLTRYDPTDEQKQNKQPSKLKKKPWQRQIKTLYLPRNAKGNEKRASLRAMERACDRVGTARRTGVEMMISGRSELF